MKNVSLPNLVNIKLIKNLGLFFDVNLQGFLKFKIFYLQNCKFFLFAKFCISTHDIIQFNLMY